MKDDMMTLKDTASQDIYLRQWEEFQGIFERIEAGDLDFAVVFSCKGEEFKVRLGEVDADTVKKELLSCKSGIKIALLKTDEASRQFLVRTIAKERCLGLQGGEDNSL
jgi:hypothetical protein